MCPKVSTSSSALPGLPPALEHAPCSPGWPVLQLGEARGPQVEAGHGH